ncbi:hypothetical protein FISHEDRAFT_46799 [Fistulina hepatica ATCC 64428]|uniref:Phosducin domain-containing protein n=1 Tax=Fistulina hepatica ATCC 64428 TaxID=1128425 RepID=A0A0D7A9T6_9AGAR|nr:hypothetical protein FISHEDRAFT_46799 [Fistulina hepatica ATCC 64428]
MTLVRHRSDYLYPSRINILQDGVDLEKLVLSGEFFNGSSRSSSPRRRSPSSPSTSDDEDLGWHDELLNKAPDVAPVPGPSIGMGVSGRTGVKGVIRDRNESDRLAADKRQTDLQQRTEKWDAAARGGKTYLEEEREKLAAGEKADELVFQELERDIENTSRTDRWGIERSGRFGHLREVGMRGFVDAVEKETSGTWVVVHLYDPSLERCHILDENLTRLARLHPETKFLRARAAALGFASTGASIRDKYASKSTSVRKQPRDDDEDDPFSAESDDLPCDEEDSYDEYEDGVDLDMLPTMLVYRDGNLVHNWVRIDWEADARRDGIDGLLER